jgi:septum formation protein
MAEKKERFHLYLGSQSPRRKEFFQFLNVAFETVVSNAEEISQEKDPAKFVEEITQTKMDNVWKQVQSENPMVVCSDTIVVLDNKILGKPEDKKQAHSILLLLEGQTHEVYTQVLVKTKNEQWGFHERTYVTFGKMDKGLLRAYIDTGDSLDKAGAYGAQGMAQVFIEKVEGSYSNVIGFPIERFIREVKKRYQVNDFESLFEG